MENAQLIGLSRQVALRRELAVVANNIANLNTAGFKRHSVAFEEYMMPTAEYNTRLKRDENLHYVHDRGTIRDFAAGEFQQTENPYDVALQGEGWLAVQTPNGERYTRNGAMTVNNTGNLVTHDGHPIAGADGPIVIPNDATSIVIGRDGSISVDGERIGGLRIVAFEDMNDLIADEGTVYRSDVEPVTSGNTVVLQGTIERSNVQGVMEISRLIEINRAYSSLTNALERTDRLRRDAIDKLGHAGLTV